MRPPRLCRIEQRRPRTCLPPASIRFAATCLPAILVGLPPLPAHGSACIEADLPDARPMGLVRRVRDAMDDLVDAFSLR